MCNPADLRGSLSYIGVHGKPSVREPELELAKRQGLPNAGTNADLNDAPARVGHNLRPSMPVRFLFAVLAMGLLDGREDVIVNPRRTPPAPPVAATMHATT